MEYLVAASIGIEAVSAIFGHKSQSKQNKIAARAAKLQAEELERQRKLEEERLRRENAELANSVTNLTNISWSGANAPSIAFDKYGDLG